MEYIARFGSIASFFGVVFCVHAAKAQYIAKQFDLAQYEMIKSISVGVLGIFCMLVAIYLRLCRKNEASVETIDVEFDAQNQRTHN